MQSRRAVTTGQIRAAAVHEFATVGPRALSMQGIAKRAYISIGAVYERWPNSEACILDLVTNELPDRVTAITQPWIDVHGDTTGLVESDLADPARLADLRFIMECAFAARDDERLRTVVATEIRRLGATIASRLGLAEIDPETGWWMASTWLGHALLVTSGCPIPATFVPELAIVMSRLPEVQQSQHDTARPETPSDFLAPDPTPPLAQDTTGDALVQAAADVILTHGVNEADTRRIAQEAGVSTGAIYRRYAGRGEVLDDVLRAELTPERYAWVQDFIAAVAQPDGLTAGARYLAGLIARNWQDERSATLLLEITVAAHTDPQVLAGVMREITKVADSRTALLEQFVDIGLIRDDVSASTLAWLFQISPVGMRILASIGMVPTQEALTRLMEAYLHFLLADGTQPE